MKNKLDKKINDSQIKSFFHNENIFNQDITDDNEIKKKDSIVVQILLDEIQLNEKTNFEIAMEFIILSLPAMFCNGLF